MKSINWLRIFYFRTVQNWYQKERNKYKLAIEQGRRENKPRDEILKEIEDEHHFILVCPIHVLSDITSIMIRRKFLPPWCHSNLNTKDISVLRNLAIYNKRRNVEY